MSARSLSDQLPERLERARQDAERSLEAPFRGISSTEGLAQGLFPLSRSGVPTDTLVARASAYLDSLPDTERARGQFPVTSDAWRRWSNIHPFFMRHGVSLEVLDEHQRGLALDLVASALSEQGYATARDIMRLNETLHELTGSDAEYGEWLYWLSILGTPSPSEPWGFQLDGHHLIVNCFVLGDQIVMTPMFLGSEPVHATSGRYAGTRVFAEEERAALRLAQALSPEQFGRAQVAVATPGEIFTAAYRDNLTLEREGISFGELQAPRQAQLRELIACHIERIRSGHAEVRIGEIERHLDATSFAWMGGNEDDSAFYYRVHSPVVLIEFDHLAGVAFDNEEPTRNHIHSVVRTPNGNDYGMDLLRQHYEQAHRAR